MAAEKSLSRMVANTEAFLEAKITCWAERTLKNVFFNFSENNPLKPSANLMYCPEFVQIRKIVTQLKK